MSTDNEQTEPETDENVAQGVTNTPRGTGDRDEAAIEAGEDKLEQAAGSH